MYIRELNTHVVILMNHFSMTGFRMMNKLM